MNDSRNAPLSIPRVGNQGPDPLIGRTVNDRYRIVGIIARGYENFITKLELLGADFELEA